MGRCSVKNRPSWQLEVLKPSVGGYQSAYMSAKSSLGQVICYIRPVKRELSYTGK